MTIETTDAPTLDASDTAETMATKPKLNFGSLRMIGHFTIRYPRQITYALLALIAAAASTLAIPYGLRLIIDEGFVKGIRTVLFAGASLIMPLPDGALVVVVEGVTPNKNPPESIPEVGTGALMPNLKPPQPITPNSLEPKVPLGGMAAGATVPGRGVSQAAQTVEMSSLATKQESHFHVFFLGPNRLPQP